MTEDFARQFVVGTDYHSFVAKQFLHKLAWPLVPYMTKKEQCTQGETWGGVEIKIQSKMTEYEKIYIEVAEKADKENSDWVESGILRRDNTWLWATGDYNAIHLIGKQDLLRLYHNKKEMEQFPLRETESGTSRGFVLPTSYVERNLDLKKIQCKGA